MSGFHRALLLLVPLFVACSGEPPPETRLPGQAAPEGILGGLFGGIGEGKFDSAGHPLGAQVFQAGAACRPSTGAVEVEGWGAWPALHEPGSLCDVPLKRLGIGVFTANLRVLTQVSVADSASPSPVLLTLRVLDAQGEELGRKGISAEDFRAPLTYRNVWVSFTHRSEGPVRFEVSWSGGHPVRLSYLELFRRAPGVRIEPASGLAPQGEVQIEGRYPLSQSALSLSCGDVKLDGTLAALVDAGRARRDKGDFRTLITAPAGELLGACDLPTRLRARLKRADWILAR